MTIDRKFPPRPADLNPFEIPIINSFNINHGLKTVLVQKPKLPIIQFYLTFFAGSNCDFDNKNGVANLSSLVVDEGAGEYSSIELDNEFEKLGIVFSINPSNEFTTFSVLTLKENFDRAVELLSKILYQYNFGENDFFREKNKAITGLIRLSDEPEYIAEIAFNKILYSNSVFANPVIGYKNSIEKIEIADCKRFIEKYFILNNSQLTVVGDISIEFLKDTFMKYFKDSNLGAPMNSELPSIKNTCRKFYIIDKKDSPQSEIRIGRLSSKRKEGNYFARLIMNNILGGEFVSRINLNLREDKGYTYGAHSAFNYYRNASNFIVSTSVDRNNTIKSINEIFYEFGKITESIKTEEIQFAKSYLLKKFSSVFETYQQIARNVFSLVYHDLPLNYFHTYSDQLQSVSPDEILQAAKDEILTDDMQTVIVGDKKCILEQSKNEFYFEEIELKHLIG